MRQDTVPVPGLAGFFLRPLASADIDDWYAYLSDPAAIEHTGIMRACVEALTGWGAMHHGYVRIQATVLDTNRPSMRVLEKCGFQYEGTLRHYRLVRGQPRDYLMYAWLP
jgi:hypothetical protein